MPSNWGDTETCAQLSAVPVVSNASVRSSRTTLVVLTDNTGGLVSLPADSSRSPGAGHINNAAVIPITTAYGISANIFRNIVSLVSCFLLFGDAPESQIAGHHKFLTQGFLDSIFDQGQPHVYLS